MSTLAFLHWLPEKPQTQGWITDCGRHWLLPSEVGFLGPRMPTPSTDGQQLGPHVPAASGQGCSVPPVCVLGPPASLVAQ